MRLVEFLDRLDEKRPPREMYHGTSSAFLRGILKQGVVPNPKQKKWDVDPQASAGSLSRVSLGGSYWSSNLMTSRSAAQNTTQKFGGNTLVVIAMISEGSAYADEDSINFGLMRAPAMTYVELFGQGLTPEAAALNLANIYFSSQEGWNQILGRFTGSQLKDLGFDYDDFEKGINLGDIIAKKFAEALHEELAVDPQKQPIPYDFLKQVLEAMLLRALAYEAKSYEGSYSPSPHISGWQSKVEKGIAPELPSTEEAEQRMLVLREQLTRTYTKTAYHDEQAFSHTLRTEEPVTYRGSNRIIGVLEEEDNYEARMEGYYAPLILHYGKITEDFLRQYRARVGKFPGAVDSQGQMVMQPDAQEQ